MKFSAPVLLRSPLFLALLTAGCVGGGGGGAATATTASPQAASYRERQCLDSNGNLACDDGDIHREAATRSRALPEPLAGQRVLLERIGEHDGSRQSLLVSELGSSQVDGLSTLLAFLVASGQAADSSAARAQVRASLGTPDTALSTTLGDSYRRYQQQYGSSASVLAAISQQMLLQKRADPQLDAAKLAPVVAAVQEQPWLQGSGEDNAELLAAAAEVTVLANSGRNRLFVLTANGSREIELENNPLAGELVAERSVEHPLQRGLQLASRLLVDTVSAASGIITPPPRPQPPKPQPPRPPIGGGGNAGGGDGGVPPVVAGKHHNRIAGLTLSGDGQYAYLLLNSANGKLAAQDGCGNFPQNHGVFKLSLRDSGEAYRQQALYQLPACTHHGFSRLASDRSGKQLLALAAPERELYLLDGDSMQARRRISLDFLPQQLALTAGGRYAALAAGGYLALYDLQDGRRIAELGGGWGEVSALAFAGDRLLLASGDTLYRVNVQQMTRPQPLPAQPQGATILGLSVGSDGQQLALALAGKRIQLLDAGGERALARLDTGVEPQLLAWQPGRLVYGSRSLRAGAQHGNSLGALVLGYHFPFPRF